MLAFKFTAILASLSTLALVHGSPAPMSGPPAELHHLLKRQLGPGSPSIQVPASCETQCRPYLETGASCASLSPGGSSTTSQAQILRCMCTSDFFGPFVACLECAPQAFLDDSFDVSIKELVDAGIQQCAAAGTPVTGVDTSNLPDGSASGSSASAPAAASSSIQYTGGGGAIAPGASGNTGTGILTVTGTLSRTSATASGPTSVANAAGSSSVTSAATTAATPTVGGGGGAAAAGMTVHAGLAIAILSVVAGHFALRI